jgi:putative tricarboxylic transport membrane protein
MLSYFWDGLIIALSPPTVIWLILGTVIGLIVGFLPAIGALVGVVLFLPLTYGMDLASSVVFLVTIYATGQYGDSISSILLNTPGGPGTIASCWEGFPMAQRGEGARALGIATFGSMIGGLVGCAFMLALAWPLTEIAMMIGPPEYFALGIMAIALISIASKGETIKGLIMGCIGVLLACIGEDPVTAMTDRFSFSSVQLAAGLPTMGIFTGLFAIAQIIRMMEEGANTVSTGKTGFFLLKDTLKGLWDIISHPVTVIRSIAIGTYIGILPALGVTTATVSSYLIEKRYSKEGKNFGKGVPSGLVAAEVAKGCCVVGDMIPTFMLGIPGSTAGAVVMAAFVMHGIHAGPQFLLSGTAPFVVFAGITLAQIIIVVAGLPLIKLMGIVVKLQNAILAPILTVLCFIGAFSERNMTMDILFLIIFGILGYAFDKLRYSTISLIIGLIIAPLLETNFHRTLVRGEGSLYLLWTRPLTVLFFGITILFLIWPYLKVFYLSLRGKVEAKEIMLETDNVNHFEFSVAEFILLGSFCLFAVLLLVDARSYQYATKLFPLITCYAMLLLIVLRVIAGIKRKARILPLNLKNPFRVLSTSLSWQFSILTFIGYLLVTYSIGFFLATAFYLLTIPWLLGYRKKKVIVALCIAVVLSAWGIAKALNLILPEGFLI